MAKKLLKNLLHIALVLVAVLLIAVYAINSLVVDVASNKVLTSVGEKEVDCAIILGCGVKKDGTPSDMLKDRLSVGISLYKNGDVKKLLMSGDHGKDDYDEVNVMKDYAIGEGVASEDIFMDHAGFSTYESMYRAKEIFGVESAVVITQNFHIYRALYVAEQMGIDAIGIPANQRRYRGEKYNEMREMLARCKDFVTCAVKPKPTYLGEAIAISGNGDVTND